MDYNASKHSTSCGKIQMDYNASKHSTSCGRFQIIQVFFLQLPRFVSIWGIFLLVFGNYNPGWRCIPFDINNGVTDTNTTTGFYNDIILHTTTPTPPGIVDKKDNLPMRRHVVYSDIGARKDQNLTSILEKGGDEKYDGNTFMDRDDNKNARSSDVEHKQLYYNGTCDVIKSCRSIQFNPESSTIITEFGLICDQDWVPALILTVVNAGFFAGSFISGQICERYGRKAGLYGSTLALAISSGAAVFSPNWETYAFLTFFIGASGFGIISASVVFTMEFLNSRWRGYMSSRPIASLSLCVLSLVISLLKSWKHLHAVTCIASGLSLLGFFFVSESPRWLFVNSHHEKGFEIVQKIAKRNRKPLDCSGKNSQELIEQLDKVETSISYSYLNILKTKEHLITTIKFSILMIFELFLYHAFIFGVKSVPGDFYTNAIVSSFIQAAIVLSAGPFSNFTGRRASGFMYSFLGSLLCASIVTSVFVAEGYTQSMIIKISAYLAKAASQATISVSLLCAAEIFPTAIRSVGVSFVNGIACVGGLIAPYVIPRNGDGTSFAICFSVMAVCFLATGGIFYLLPETKNENLKDSVSTVKRQNEIENGTC